MERRSSGFTLVEMLVVISIITVLAALILPAVQNAREAARRAECQNNIRQIGLAMTQFSTAKARLPARGHWLSAADGTGQYVSRNSTTTAGTALAAHSWVVDALPYLEQQEIHTRWNFHWPYHADDAGNSTNLTLSGIFLKILVCPDDDTIQPGEGNLSYVVNGGFFPDYQRVAGAIDYNQVDGTGDAADVANCRDAGLAWPNWERAVSSITDGTSTTVLLTESLRAGYDDTVTPQSSWANPDRCQFRSRHPDDSSYPAAYDGANNINAPLPTGEGGYVDSTETLSGGATLINPTSYHPGGVNVCFCDGHVQFIGQNVSGRVWAALITPRGGRISTARLQQLPPDEDDY